MTTADELRRVVLSLPEAEERETWGVPAHVGRHGWVSIQLATVDPTELGELVAEAWRQTAPSVWSPPTTPPRGDVGAR